MRNSMMLALACGALAVACLIGGGLFFMERPTVLRVAVPNSDQSDYGLLSAAGKVVRHGHHPIRFKVVPVDDAATAATRLDDGGVDMAVVRTDDAMPAQGQTVVILHRDAAILVATAAGGIKEIGDLADHTVGLVGGQSGNRALLETALQQYEIDPKAVKTIELAQDAVADAVASKQVDAILVVGIISGEIVQKAVKAMAHGGGGAPVFLPITDAAAIAQRSPAYDSFEVVKGAFRGSPPQPADEFDTLSVTHRLVASTLLSDTVVADVTRFFLNERGALAAVDPIARRIEAPSTDKGAALPAHSGTAAYIDDEEETFLDQYSDFIYLGAMFFGVIASGGTAVFSRLNARGARAVEKLTDRLVEIMKLVRFAPSPDLLHALESETDEIVATVLQQETARALDERRLGTLGLALDQVREAIRDRRLALQALATQPLHAPFTALHVASAE